jgi:hypothetical protein
MDADRKAIGFPHWAAAKPQVLRWIRRRAIAKMTGFLSNQK